jgi:cysteine desulfurase
MVKDIYLDNAATTQLSSEIADYMREIDEKYYGNPSSLHRKGVESERIIREARNKIKESLNDDSGDIIFTSGGTEANNLAVFSYLKANKRSGRKIITTAIEHPSVLNIYKYLEKGGYEITYLDVDSGGHINMEQLDKCIDKDTSMISIMSVNNEIGTIQDLEQVNFIRNRRNSKLVIHVDAVQSFCKIRMNPKKYGISMLSMSSHKINGPKGVGALYKSKNIRIDPIILGGGQEFGYRSGTENVSGIAGFGMSVEKMSKDIDERFCYVKKLKDIMMDELKSVDHMKVVSPENGSPYILCIAFEKLKAEVLLHHLSSNGIYVSTGSACSSKKNLVSHVLSAIKLDEEYLDGAIRISFCHNNTVEDVLKTVKEICKIVPKIRYKKL